ncbi:hypothetical protein ISE32_02535 [Pseudomonas aeruginosa]|nr:hypothetical protein [Pseudomonas aeruginosa]
MVGYAANKTYGSRVLDQGDSTPEACKSMSFHPDGFGHLIHKSPEFVMTDNRVGSVWLDLGAL